MNQGNIILLDFLALSSEALWFFDDQQGHLSDGCYASAATFNNNKGAVSSASTVLFCLSVCFQSLSQNILGKVDIM